VVSAEQQITAAKAESDAQINKLISASREGKAALASRFENYKADLRTIKNNLNLSLLKDLE